MWAVISCLASIPTAAQTFEVLWEAPNPNARIYPRTISPNGDHIIFSLDESFSQFVYVWSKDSSEVRDLGPLVQEVTVAGAQPSGFINSPSVVTNDGRLITVGGLNLITKDSSRTWTQAFSWVDGEFTLIGGSAWSQHDSGGMGISGDGSTVIGFVRFDSDPSDQLFFVARNGVPTVFPTPPSGRKFVTGGNNGITTDGSMIIGKMCDGRGVSFDCEAGIWTEPGYIGSGRATLKGSSSLGAIAPNGTAAVFPSDLGGFLWTGCGPITDNTGIVPIDGLLAADKVRADGALLIKKLPGFLDVPHIWTPVTGTVSHEGAMQAFGILPEGWTELSIHDASTDGTVLMGRGRAPDGVMKLWRATFTESAGKRLAVASDVCSDHIEIHTPTKGEFLKVDDLYEVTWSHPGTPDPFDELIISYSDFYDEQLGSVFPPTRIDTIPGNAERYSMIVPNASSKKSAILISRKSRPFDYFASEVFTLRGYDLVREIEGDYEPFRPSIHGWPFSNSRGNLFPDSGWYTNDQFDYSFGTDPFSGGPYSLLLFPAKSDVFPDWPSYVRAFGTANSYLTGAEPLPVFGYRAGAILLWHKYHHGERWGGSCSGMSTTALMKFTDPNRFDEFASTVATPAFTKDLSQFDQDKLKDSPTAGEFAIFFPNPREIVNSRQIYWWGEQARRAAKAGRKLNTRQVLATIKAFFMFDGNANYPTSYLYISEDSVGAHAVVPYRLEVEDRKEGIYRAYIYDPNYPLDDTKYIEIDSTANFWYYDDIVDGWGGVRDIFMMNPIADYFEPTPFQAKLSAGKHPTNSDPLLGIGVTPGVNSTLRAPNGQTLKYKDGVASGDYLDGFVDLPPVGGPVLPRGYVVKAGESYVLQVDVPDDSLALLNIQADDGNILYHYHRQDAARGQTDHFQFDADGGFSAANRDTVTKQIRLIGVAPRGDREVFFSTDSLMLTVADSVQFAIVADRQMQLGNAGPAKSYDLVIELGAVQSRKIFRSADVPFGAGETHTTQIDWDLFGQGPVVVGVDEDGDGTPDSFLQLENEVTGTGAEKDPQGMLPNAYGLAQNFPNPFTDQTTIHYTLPQADDVRLTLMDVLGRKVAVMASGRQSAGRHEVRLDATALPSGLYFYRLQAGNYVETRQMVVVK